jgi:hypothetical protein
MNIGGRTITREMLADPAVQRLLRPITLRFLASLGLSPMVDSATGDAVVSVDMIAKALGIPVDDAIEATGDDAVAVPTDQARPLH